MILNSYDKLLSMDAEMEWIRSVGEPQPTRVAIGVSKSLLPHTGSLQSEDSDQDFKDHEHNVLSVKGKAMLSWTNHVRVYPGSGLEGALADGYGWRKYGQKEILGCKYPRGYYRCVHRNIQGCLAAKQVQKSVDDPTIIEITYYGRHTCTQGSHQTPYSSGEDMAEELPIEIIEFHAGEKHCSTHVPRTERNSRLGVSSYPILSANDDQVQTSHISSEASTNVAIPKWPPHERKNVNRALLVESFQGGHGVKILGPIISHTNSHSSKSSQASNSWQSSNADTTMEDTSTLTVKAIYGNDTIKFKLFSSRLLDLQHQVEKRLNIKGGTYYIKYKDEEDDELILIPCDEDLQDYIDTSTRLGRTFIKILIELK